MNIMKDAPAMHTTRHSGLDIPSSILGATAWWAATLMIAIALSQTSTVLAQNRSITQPGTSTWVYEGFTEPRYDILVAATEIGRLAEVSVEVGDRVTAGQIAGRLEDDLQRSAVAIAQHQSEMSGELQSSEAVVSMRQDRVNSLRTLAADRMARPDELARAQTDLRIASGQLLTVQEQLKLRQLELERAKLQLERRRIRIPMNGVVSEVFHHPGEYITPSDPAICRLLVLDQLYAVFNIPVEETSLLEVGTPARVFLRSTSTTLDASITSISPAIDGESGTVRVRVALDNPDRKLLVGDRCTLRLIPGAASDRRSVRSTMRHRGTQGR